jgi:hypothetical protein
MPDFRPIYGESAEHAHPGAPALERTEELRQKYPGVFQGADRHGVHWLEFHYQDDRLYFRGAAPSAEAKEAVEREARHAGTHLILDLTVDAPAASGGSTYTVQEGDTLSRIAGRIYGDANHYRTLLEANGEQIKDPNQLPAGLVLTVPPK